MLLRNAAAFVIFSSVALAADAPVDFARDVQPIFEQRCAVCHGPKQHLSGLRLDDRDSANRVIKAGHAAESRLIEMVKGTSGKVMPPVGARLSDAQIGILSRWIDQGANWPASASAARHWAWEPVKNAGWAANDIDGFVLARLEKENIQPSPEADRATLLRRASLDIIGLPPTPQETTEFLDDTRPDAWARQVDRLLASPHYGEKWARYWLDLATETGLSKTSSVRGRGVIGTG
jgi:mono/diheme cytochrome c family protein